MPDMKILILDAYYQTFLNKYYHEFPEVKKIPFNEYRRHLMAQRMGTSDAYSYHLKKLGYEAEEIVANDDVLQMKWAEENGMRISGFPFSSVPTLMYKAAKKILSYNWRYKILLSQIKSIKPDILFIQESNILSDSFIKEIKPLVRLVVGQLASPVPPARTYRFYDLILTSFPHYVNRFCDSGIPAEYFALAFDDRILKEIGSPPFEKNDTIALSFVGGISKLHLYGNTILENIAAELPIVFYGWGKEHLDRNSAIRKNHRGEVWGIRMYRILANSLITINRHGEISESYANNMRLYEATGMGTCLVTDWKSNLGELFDTEKEVVTYKSADECLEKISWLLNHPAERKDIASRGQARTFRDHTYKQRMEQLHHIFKQKINC
jgi:hypothetical protein